MALGDILPLDSLTNAVHTDGQEHVGPLSVGGGADESGAGLDGGLNLPTGNPELSVNLTNGGTTNAVHGLGL